MTQPGTRCSSRECHGAMLLFMETAGSWVFFPPTTHLLRFLQNAVAVWWQKKRVKFAFALQENVHSTPPALYTTVANWFNAEEGTLLLCRCICEGCETIFVILRSKRRGDACINHKSRYREATAAVYRHNLNTTRTHGLPHAPHQSNRPPSASSVGTECTSTESTKGHSHTVSFSFAGAQHRK